MQLCCAPLPQIQLVGGLGNPVEFPVDLHGTAPLEEGNYTWEAAWFGGNNYGTDHLEQRAPATFTVEISTDVPEGWNATEGRLSLAVYPNPLTHSTDRSRGLCLFCSRPRDAPGGLRPQLVEKWTVREFPVVGPDSPRRWNRSRGSRV